MRVSWTFVCFIIFTSSVGLVSAQSFTRGRAFELLRLVRNHILPFPSASDSRKQATSPASSIAIATSQSHHTVAADGCLVEQYQITAGNSIYLTSTNYPDPYPPGECRRIILSPSPNTEVILACSDVDTAGTRLLFGRDVGGDYMRLLVPRRRHAETFYGVDVSQCAAVPFQRRAPPNQRMVVEFVSDSFLQRRGFSCAVWGEAVESVLDDTNQPHQSHFIPPLINDQYDSSPTGFIPQFQQHPPVYHQSQDDDYKVDNFASGSSLDESQTPVSFTWPNNRRQTYRGRPNNRRLKTKRFIRWRKRPHSPNRRHNQVSGKTPHRNWRKRYKRSNERKRNYFSNLSFEGDNHQISAENNSLITNNSREIDTPELIDDALVGTVSSNDAGENKNSVLELTTPGNLSINSTRNTHHPISVNPNENELDHFQVNRGSFPKNIGLSANIKFTNLHTPSVNTLNRNSSRKNEQSGDSIDPISAERRIQTEFEPLNHSQITADYSPITEQPHSPHYTPFQQLKNPKEEKEKDKGKVELSNYEHDCGLSDIPSVSARVFGGSDSRPGHYPWVVYLVSDTPEGPTATTYCTGSLVSNKWVITAAHCIDFARSTTVHLGFLDLSREAPETEASNKNNYTLKLEANQYRVHRQWTRLAKEHDIGLIKLPNPVRFTRTIRPICLPNRRQIDQTFAGYSAEICGWGKTKHDQVGGSFMLQWAEVNLKDSCSCMTSWPISVTPLRICAHSRHASPCQGDSGGPLQVKQADGRYLLIGVSSFTSSRGCDVGLPSMYTRLTAYLHWIETNSDLKFQL